MKRASKYVRPDGGFHTTIYFPHKVTASLECWSPWSGDATSVAYLRLRCGQEKNEVIAELNATVVKELRLALTAMERYMKDAQGGNG